jgi:hypothetical protein
MIFNLVIITVGAGSAGAVVANRQVAIFVIILIHFNCEQYSINGLFILFTNTVMPNLTMSSYSAHVLQII